MKLSKNLVYLKKDITNIPHEVCVLSLLFLDEGKCFYLLWTEDFFIGIL